MTKEERLLRQEQRERAKAIEAAAREAGRGPLDLPYLLPVTYTHLKLPTTERV